MSGKKRGNLQDVPTNSIKLDSEPLLEEARRIEADINEMMSGSVNQPPGPASGGNTSMFG